MANVPTLTAVAQEFADQNNLVEVHFVGKGAFKETYKVTAADDEYRALKLSDPSKCSALRTQREIDALLRCDTLLICKLYNYGTFRSAGGMEYYFSLEEFLDGGSLSSQIERGSLSPEIVRSYAISLVRALDYLKGIDLVHRDIKPDNIMFRTKSPEPVLVDLGLVRDLSESSITPSWVARGPGTPYYSAPEQLNNEKNLIDWRTDQFALGIVVGICLIGQHPFRESSMTIVDTIMAIGQRRSCTDQFRTKVSALGFGGIIKMLEPWPHRRYQSIGDLCKCFQGRA